jgi:hypothetical protein
VVVTLHLALGTHDRHLSAKSAHGKPVEFDGSFLAAPEKRHITLIDSHIDRGSRGVDDFRERIARFQTMSD